MTYRIARPCFFIAGLAFALLGRMPAPAQTPSSDESAADASYVRHDWPAAEKLYASLAQEHPDNARFWFRLGVAERANQHYPSAMEAFKKAGDLGKALPKSILDYEVATTLAGMGDKTNAVGRLKNAADGGFSQPTRLDSDPEWNQLRGDPQFLAIAKQVRHNAQPCDDPEFSQFDFWVGDWDVTSTADGIARGSSHVSKEMGGCVVWENWTSASSPYFGKSYNTYNANLKRWEQYWVDNFAGVMFFHGNLKDQVMDYWTDDVPQSNGDMLRRHLQFFHLASGKVRQLSQGSTDGGKTWNVEYDLTYTRHPETGAAISGVSK
jgi:tetratricopeptide (TPR) repeat protein